MAIQIDCIGGVLAARFRRRLGGACPEKLTEQTARSIESARAAFAAAAEKEAAQVQRVLSEKVAETSVQIARKLAERPVGLHRVTTMLAAVVAFGTFCASAGYSLGAPERPFWVTKDGGLGGAQRGLSVVLALPAGWMIFALLLRSVRREGGLGAGGRHHGGAPRQDHRVVRGDLHLPETVIGEAHFFEDDAGVRHGFDLAPYVADGRIKQFAVSAADVKAFVATFGLDYIEKLDAGEAESLSYLERARTRGIRDDPGAGEPSSRRASMALIGSERSSVPGRLYFSRVTFRAVVPSGWWYQPGSS
jgi:hypothetical protein